MLSFVFSHGSVLQSLFFFLFDSHLPEEERDNCSDIIKIHHECEDGIEKSVPRITNLHHEACRVMTNGIREGRILNY